MKKVLLYILSIFLSANVAFSRADPYSAAITGYTSPYALGIAQTVVFTIGNGDAAATDILPNSVYWTMNFPGNIMTVGTPVLPSGFVIVSRATNPINGDIAIVIKPTSSIPPLTELFVTVSITGTVPNIQGTMSLNNATQPGFGGTVGNLDPGNDNASSPVIYSIKLPLKLLYFNGSKKLGSSFLSWKFQDAANFSHFEIERSPDGKNFVKINEQAHSVTQGALRQSVIVSYQILDETPLRRYNYYRLKMVDLDGTFTYSNTVKINFEDGPVNVFPNPFTNNLQIEGLNSDTEARIEIYDESGKILYKYKSLSSGITSLENIYSLNPGLYMIKIIQEDKLVMVKKVVKL